jgi:hypothetical protein
MKEHSRVQIDASFFKTESIVPQTRSRSGGSRKDSTCNAISPGSCEMKSRWISAPNPVSTCCNAVTLSNPMYDAFSVWTESM